MRYLLLLVLFCGCSYSKSQISVTVERDGVRGEWTADLIPARR